MTLDINSENYASKNPKAALLGFSTGGMAFARAKVSEWGVVSGGDGVEWRSEEWNTMENEANTGTGKNGHKRLTRLDRLTLLYAAKLHASKADWDALNIRNHRPPRTWNYTTSPHKNGKLFSDASLLPAGIALTWSLSTTR